MSDDCFAYTVGGFVTGILLAFGKVLITGSMDYTILIIGIPIIAIYPKSQSKIKTNFTKSGMIPLMVHWVQISK